MFNTKLKKHALITGAAILALTASASSMAALVPNGDFSSGGANWGTEAGGGTSFSFPTDGGNGGGYLQMDNTTAAWGGVAVSTDDPAGSPLSTFGVVAGQTYDFEWDMKIFSGSGAGMGIKLESWDDNGVIVPDTGDLIFAATTDWATYTQSYTINPLATRLKIVLLGLNADSVMGFDNMNIVGAVPVPAAVWLFGSGLLGLIGVARKKKA